MQSQERTETPAGDASEAPAFTPAPPRRRTLHRNAFYALAVGVAALDQAVKAWTREALAVGESIPLWPGVFHITHTQNRGMAFSLLEGQTPVLVLAAVVVTGLIVAAQRRLGARLPALLGWALALALGGAVGNLIDRIRLGYVTDLFDARIIHFPVFNVADTAITFGIALLAWRTLTAPAGPEDPPLARPAAAAAPEASAGSEDEQQRTV
ncbi:MAG TPA: signal peptidase II [Armatimonadaceae bacterium]|nr:signal peptidase II [Armatimonadaceae bacterium]